MGKPKVSSGRPPRKPVARMDPEQERALVEHLRRELSAPETELLLLALRDWYLYGPHFATPAGAAEAEARRRRSERIADQARSLRRELRAEAADLGILAAAVDVPALAAALERAATVSARLAAPRAARPRGPPVLQWRDDLIALVHAHYPAEKIARSRASHFTRTVEILLGFLGEETEDMGDLCKQIARVMRRKPAAPFVVRLI